MAKKILSILCALTMLVTMVSVAAFSASAAESANKTIVFPDFTNMSVNPVEAYGDTNLTYASIGSGVFTSEALGTDAMVVCYGKQSATIGTYNVVDSFQMSYNSLKIESRKETAPYYYQNDITIGDLTISVHEADTAYHYTVEVSYGDQHFSGSSTATEGNIGYSRNTSSHEVFKKLYGSTDAELYKAFPNATFAGSTTGGTFIYGGMREIHTDVTYANNVVTVTVSEPVESQKYTYTATIDGEVTLSGDLDISVAEATHRGTLLFGFEGSCVGVKSNVIKNVAFPDLVGSMANPVEVYNDETLKYAKNGSGVYYSNALQTGAMVVSDGKQSATIGYYDIADTFNISYKSLRHNASSATSPYHYLNQVTIGDLNISVHDGTQNFYYTVEVSAGEHSDNGSSTSANGNIGEYISINEQSPYNALYTTGGELLTAFPNAEYMAQNAMRQIQTDITYANNTLTVKISEVNYKGTLGNDSFTFTTTLPDTVKLSGDLTISIAEEANYGTLLYDFSGSCSIDPSKTLLPDGAFLTVNDSLAIDFAYESGKLNGLAAAGYSNVTATATVADHPELNKTFALSDDTAIGGYDCFVFDTLTPDLFGTTVTFTVNATYNSKPISADFEYSVKEYCVNKMSKPTDADHTDELKTLCYSILEYGEAVRLWKISEGKSAPATSITDGVDTTYKPTAWDVTAASNTAAKTDEETDAVWGGMNLNLADNVGLNLYFTINNGTLGDYDVEADNSKSASFGPSVGDEHCAVVRIFAYNMENPVTAYITESGERVSKKYVVSVKDYVVYAIKNDEFTDAAKTCAISLMTYGAAAYDYAF